jgi:hypothetical protein
MERTAVAHGEDCSRPWRGLQSPMERTAVAMRRWSTQPRLPTMDTATSIHKYPSLLCRGVECARDMGTGVARLLVHAVWCAGVARLLVSANWCTTARCTGVVNKVQHTTPRYTMHTTPRRTMHTVYHATMHAPRYTIHTDTLYYIHYTYRYTILYTLYIPIRYTIYTIHTDTLYYIHYTYRYAILYTLYIPIRYNIPRRQDTPRHATLYRDASVP